MFYTLPIKITNATNIYILLFSTITILTLYELILPEKKYIYINKNLAVHYNVRPAVNFILLGINNYILYETDRFISRSSTFRCSMVNVENPRYII